MEWVTKSGLADLLPELLTNKVYVGVSAGSTIVSKHLDLEASQTIYEENLDRTDDLDGLNLINFYCFSHLNSSYFPRVRSDLIKEFAQQHPGLIYAFDDHSALKVVDDRVEVISEGQWLIFNN